MVNNGADNNGTGYNLIMANRKGARTGALSAPPKLQPTPSSSARGRLSSAKPAANGRKANSKRTGDAIPAASPSRSHRGKLRKSVDPVDADGDVTMGGTAAAPIASGRYAALGDDTSSEDEGKNTDDKDPNETDESEGTDDDDVDGSGDDFDDDSDDVEIIEESAAGAKNDPPVDTELIDSLEDDEEDIDLDEYEDPSDSIIAWSPEFRRLMQHNSRCVACGCGDHTDARSSACPLMPSPPGYRQLDPRRDSVTQGRQTTVSPPRNPPLLPSSNGAATARRLAPGQRVPPVCPMEDAPLH